MVDFDALRKKKLREKQFMGIDWEGQSLLDISDVGATQYASHPSSEILCLGFQNEVDYVGKNYDANIWIPEFGADHDSLDELKDAVLSEEFTFVAHNAQFDLTYWKWMHARGKFPIEPPKHWICTAQRASVNGLPRGLDECCAALGLPGKDKEGHKLLMKYCKPKLIRGRRGEPGTYVLTPRNEIPTTDMHAIWGYNRTDIRRMWQIKANTKPVSEAQQLYYELDRLINARGFAVDLRGVDALIARLEEAQEELALRAFDLTGGSPINLNSTDQLHAYCESFGWHMPKMDAHHIRVALADERCPQPVRQMLELRQLAALKASSKFSAFKQRGMLEGDFLIVRDWAVVDGAHTGRHSAKGFQAHNLKREVCSEEEVDSLMSDPLDVTRLLFDEPLRLAGMAVRPMVIARKPEHVLLIGDFSRIELATLFWYAKERQALADLEAGVDLYKRLASTVYERPEAAIDKEQRQLGKTGVLGNGYGLGADGFRIQLTEKYGMPITQDVAERAVYGYRNMFPNVPKFWRKVGGALFNAVESKGTPYQFGNLKFIADDSLLVIILPDGSKLRYQKPYIDGKDVYYWGEDSKTRQWVPIKFWGGAATGHIVQATANRLQRCAAFDLTEAGFDIVLHAHDELVCEDVPERLEEFSQIMALENKRREWMAGMLIVVDAKATKRYRK